MFSKLKCWCSTDETWINKFSIKVIMLIWDRGYSFTCVYIKVCHVNFRSWPLTFQQLPVKETPMDSAINNLRDSQWKDVRNVLTPAFSGKKMKQVTWSDKLYKISFHPVNFVLLLLLQLELQTSQYLYNQR